MSKLNLTAATPAELRAECDRLGITYRTKDDRKTLTRKIVNATKSTSDDDTPMSVEELRDPQRIADALSGALDTPQPAADRAERLRLAKQEHKTLQAWVKSGEKPPRPATPNLDALEAESNGPRTATGGKPKSKSGKSTKSGDSKRGTNVVIASGMRFFRDGTPYSDRDNGRLSNVAARAKISASELRDVLTKAGVALDAPLSKPFSVTVSSGVKIELRRESKSQRAAS